jgi:hypothetical protein
MTDRSVIDWLLDSDPAIRWQVLRDLVDAPEADWAAERRKVETIGWGAQLLSHQDADGQWAGGAFADVSVPFRTWKEPGVGQPWTTTCWALCDLRDYGLDPSSDSAKRTVELVGKNSKWEEGNQPFWEGEVEECINGRTVALGAYFGVDIAPIVKRLVGERLSDGAWNCERCEGSKVSSFVTTINVLEGLLEFEKGTGGTPESIAARKTGEEYLLRRHLFKRLSTGEPASDRFLQLLHPPRWHYDILRALDYFRAAAQLNTNSKPDPRLAQAIELLRSKRTANGRWALERDLEGKRWFRTDEGVGEPSRWITLKAWRILRWWDKEHE